MGSITTSQKSRRSNVEKIVDILIVIAAAVRAFWPSYAGSKVKLAMSALYKAIFQESYLSTGCSENNENSYARTAFISMIAIVLPMHMCGPAINENVENVEL